MPDNASSFGASIDQLMWLITVLGIPCLIIAETVLFIALARGRKQLRAAGHIKGNTWSQLRWVVVPVIIVLCLDLFIDARNAQAWHAIKESLPKQGLHVRITAQQFSWSATYAGPDGVFDTPDDVHLSGEVHVPVDTDVIFDLQSRDVLHSLWVPALRLKQDAVPGRTIHGWFRATTCGHYDIACAQLCGPGHTRMGGAVVVDSAAEFAMLMSRQRSTTAGPGAAIAQKMGCVGCHSTDGSTLVGPSWKGLYGHPVTVTTNGADRTVTADDAYLERSIREPAADVVKGFPNVMPSFKGRLSDSDVKQLVDYIKKLD
jgi:cytochrome c oxidase subunit 2